ncbi:MAG: (Fe-S)-binding protein [Deltaproteobacteria bacterium]|nr:(Fe-S)-binding protein [Deltaproteobacteria bacterium]
MALLSGCARDQMMPQISRDTVEVLQRNGIEVVEMPGQGCGGALPLHSGRRDEAVTLARTNLAAFARINDVDAFVTSAAGCGAMVRDYAHLLADTDVDEEAQAFSALCRDVCELLVEAGFVAPARPLTSVGPVAYHDACHLLHARGIAAAPRKVCEVATGAPPVDLGARHEAGAPATRAVELGPHVVRRQIVEHHGSGHQAGAEVVEQQRRVTGVLGGPGHRQARSARSNVERRQSCQIVDRRVRDGRAVADHIGEIVAPTLGRGAGAVQKGLRGKQRARLVVRVQNHRGGAGCDGMATQHDGNPERGGPGEERRR